MNTIEKKERKASKYVIREARFWVCTYSHTEDCEAAKLALLWCAFETEAMAQGLTTWRGVKLGDDHANNEG